MTILTQYNTSIEHIHRQSDRLISMLCQYRASNDDKKWITNNSQAVTVMGLKKESKTEINYNNVIRHSQLLYLQL